MVFLVVLKMKVRLLMFLALVLFSIPFLKADASCSSFVPVVDNILAYDEASVVFFGTVINAYAPHIQDAQKTLTSLEYTTFSVHYILKGDLPENKVATHPNSSVEYIGFEDGETYFVYAFGPQNEVHLCTAPAVFPLSMMILIFHVSFLLIPIAIVVGLVVVWRKRK